MVIGIIDTGIDPSHRDMILSEGTDYKITEEDVEASDAPGKWFTEKVPYGYNYIDKSFDILDQVSSASHGMHVGGTSAANGDEENGGIKGVAPEAQLLALKVFGNDPMIQTTYGDIYVKAIDDAIKLGVDVLNLSLGATAAFVNAEDPEQKAIRIAQESGVVASISAGNSAHFSNGYAAANPYASNPDIGLTGSPSLSNESVSVASSENSYIEMEALEFTASNGDKGLIPYLSAGNVHPTELTGEYEIVDAGLGAPADFEGKDVQGKIALIQRGSYAFVDKSLAAQAAGAVGSIIYNNVAGFISMASSNEITIPHVSIGKSEGDALVERLTNGETVTMKFEEGAATTTLNPEAGSMSSFTSWGVTPNLDFKPEITAPGGNILSTLEDNSYGLMSGTSMAAPHVAGGSALILERIDAEFGVNGTERALLAKNILMNTATPLKDLSYVNDVLGWNNYYSPRRQGAGQMDLHAASTTPAYVVNPEDGVAKVALKEVTDHVTFKLDVTNFSDETVQYDVEKTLQTDLAVSGELGFNPSELEAAPIVDAEVKHTVGGQVVQYVTVTPGSTVTVDFEIDLSAAKMQNILEGTEESLKENFENGYFVEGFVTFVDPTDTNPSLSVPFVGFNGDWDQAPVVDAPHYDENTFYGTTGMITNTDLRLGFKPGPEGTNNYAGAEERLAFSPSLNSIMPYLSFLRNAKEVQYNVLDKDGKHLRTITTQKDVSKNFDQTRSTNLVGAAAWDGKVKNKVVEDGIYIYEIKAKVDFSDAEWQKLQFPIHVDTVAPVVEVDYDAESEVLTWSAEDAQSGVSHFDILVNGTSILGKDEVIPSNETNNYQVDLTDVPTGATITVKATDFARNDGVGEVKGIGDNSMPLLFITHPSTLGYYNTQEVPVQGYVTNASEIKVVTVAGEEFPVTYDADTNRYNFSGTVNVEADGVYDIKIETVDVAGNEAHLNRQIIVDSQEPVIEVSAPTNTTEEEATLSITLKDNFDELRFSIDGSEVLYEEFKSPYEMRSIERAVEQTVSLESGENTFELVLTDVAGNETVKNVTINKVSGVDEVVSRLSGATRFETAVETSKAGWETASTVVLVNSNSYADALAGLPLAYKNDAPVLLTSTGSLNAATSAEITRLGAEKVIVLGGTAVVSEDVVSELEALNLEVERISGANRYETAEQIAKQVAPNGTDKAVVVNGFDFPDALSIAPYAAKAGMPILLANKNEIQYSTVRTLDRLGVDETFVIGGTAVVGNEVTEMVPGAVRISGSTRYETNLAVIEKFASDADQTFVATGKNFADALTGSALAAKHNTGIVLVGNDLSAEVADYITGNSFRNVTVFGGEGAISAKVLEDLKTLYSGLN
nr:cell wall-binding repeat-containing protein [Bacillus suaedae]